MRRCILLLLGVALMTGGLLSCIRVPTPTEAVKELVKPSTPPTKEEKKVEKDVSDSATPPLLTAADAKKALDQAKSLLSAGTAYVEKLKVDVKEKKKQYDEKQRQEVADRITRDGWYVFAAGLLATIIGAFCVAKNYGFGGWWVLGSGAATMILGLTLVWLGQYWLAVVRIGVGVTAVAFILGAWWAWCHRRNLKASARQTISQSLK